MMSCVASILGRDFVTAVDTIRELTAVSKKNKARMTIEFIVVQKLFTVTVHRKGKCAHRAY